ncbi:MAG: hypothetical protein HY302_08425 [Opitutae bacterium]|nr:hypothetical protein [Opitutae bacterium]
MKMAEAAAQLNVEAQSDERTTRGEASRRDYVFVESVLGLDVQGSVYHPNLLEFLLQPEFGASWQTLKLDPPGGRRQSVTSLQRYHARLGLLREKAYATHLFAERGRTHRDLDFFSRARVDSLRYGGHTGYTAGRVPVALDALHLAETVTGGLGRATEVASDTFTFNASHAEQPSHETEFSYELNSYRREEAGNAPTAGTSQSANLLDRLAWGTDDWATLNSTALFNRLSSTTSKTRSLTLQENLALAVRPDVTVQGHYAFGDHGSEVVASRSHEGRASVRHQLYESLTSTLAVQGATSTVRGGGATLAADRVGVTVEESYTKRLPAEGRLSLSASWRGDQQRRTTTGERLFVSDEVLTLTDRRPSFLLQPGVVAVGQVTDVLGVAFAETLDYVLVVQGALTEIRRVPGGRIADGGQVLVDYTAAVPPSDRFATVMQFYQVRLDLFDGLVGLYGRLNLTDNRGGKSVVLQNLAGQVVGAEIRWRWLQAGVEHERLDSNLSPFRSTRVFQSSTFELGPSSTLSLDLELNQTAFPDTGRTRESRNAIGRYRRQLAAFLTCELEGGLRRERGPGFDQDRVAARAALNYAYGKLVLNFSYDYEDENLVGELRRRQHVLLQIKRTF